MLGDVGDRAAQALLLAAPQRQANRAPRCHPDRLQDADRLEHHRRANGVVGGAGGGVPRVEVTAQHHHLLRPVAAGNLGDDVVLGAALGEAAIDDRRLDLHDPAAGYQPGNPAVVFIAHHHRRHRFGNVEGAVVEGADLAVLAPGVVDAQRRAGIDQEYVQRFSGLIGREHAGGRRRRRRWVEAAAAPAGELRPRLVVVAPLGRRIDRHVDLGRRSDHHRPALQAAAQPREEGVEILLRRVGRWVDDHRGRGDRPVGARCPRQRLDHQRVLHRRHDVQRRPVVQPPRMAEVPLLEVRVLQPPRRGLLHHPVLRRAQVGRAGQPRPVHIGEDVQGPHDLRALDRLATDLPDDVVVDALGWRSGAALLVLLRQWARDPHRGDDYGAQDDRCGGKSAHPADYTPPIDTAAPGTRLGRASSDRGAANAAAIEQPFYNPRHGPARSVAAAPGDHR